jgi:predicted RNase H-like HicB family nuclease
MNKITVERGEVFDTLCFKLSTDISKYNAIIIRENEGSYISTCINLRIDGYGKTADEAIKDMKEYCEYFLKRNSELLSAEDAKENILDLLKIDDWAKELWEAYHEFIDKGGKMKHSDRIYDFCQYLWGDILEDQCLLHEIVELLNDAGDKLEKARDMLIENPEYDKKVME